MKTVSTAIIALVGSALVLTALTGCSSPLTGKQIDSEIKVTAPSDTLLNDAVSVSYLGTLAGKRTDPVVIRIQSSIDGTTWSTVKTVKDKGPKLAASYKMTVKVAGTVKYRATVSATAKAKNPLGQVGGDASATIAASDIKDMIRKFYYDRTIAFQTSPTAGTAWIAANDSPIYNAAAPTFTAGLAQLVTDKDVETSVPDLTTISPDPTWTLTGATSCNAAMTAPPKGRTYVVTVTFGGSYGGFPVADAKHDVHVTLDGGKLVDYVQGCAS